MDSAFLTEAGVHQHADHREGLSDGGEEGPGEEQVGAVNVGVVKVDDVGRQVEREGRDVDDDGHPEREVRAVAGEQRGRERLGAQLKIGMMPPSAP